MLIDASTLAFSVLTKPLNKGAEKEAIWCRNEKIYARSRS
jgi:hypothetical protein